MAAHPSLNLLGEIGLVSQWRKAVDVDGDYVEK
jgi:hypothetical protein